LHGSKKRFAGRLVKVSFLLMTGVPRLQGNNLPAEM